VLEKIFIAIKKTTKLKDTAQWGQRQPVLIKHWWERSCQRRCDGYNK